MQTQMAKKSIQRSNKKRRKKKRHKKTHFSTTIASVITSLSRYPQADVNDSSTVHTCPGVPMSARIALLKMCTAHPISMYGLRFSPRIGTQSDKNPYPTCISIVWRFQNKRTAVVASDRPEHTHTKKMVGWTASVCAWVTNHQQERKTSVAISPQLVLVISYDNCENITPIKII